MAVVDSQRLARILQRIDGDLDFLQGYVERPVEEVTSDAERLRAVKYAFVTVIEGCVDAAQHICASERLGLAESNGDAMRLLGRTGILPADLTAAMVAAVGFRNLLVHGYAEVDDRRVVASLGRLGDIEAYVRAVGALLEPGPVSPE